VKKDPFRARRREVMQLMGGGIAIVPTAPHQVRNRDVYFPYRADSDFHYLTGFPEPEAVAVLAPGREEGEFILFCRPRDRERETWDGRRFGVEGARQHFGADEAHPIGDIDTVLPRLLEDCERVFVPVGRLPEFDMKVLHWVAEIKERVRTGVHAPGEIVDITHILHEMRLIKSAEELRLMRRAGRVSAEAHIRAMRACRPGMMEYEIQAELEYVFRSNGAAFPAYPPIVAGGRNALILHYDENRDPLGDGDLLLIDAGAEIEGYAGDITRTFPVNGRFSAAQREVYEVVLAAQREAISRVRAGNPWNAPHDAAVRVLTEGLIALGLLQGDVEEAIGADSYRRFYMHRTGHWLGLDVHDVGDYKVDGLWRELEPGMVLTVEPGLYIPEDDDIDPRLRGIGIRIEDDVAVRRRGHEVLTAGVPVDPDEIEALMAERVDAGAPPVRARA